MDENRLQQQEATERCSLSSIVGRVAFRRGVEDILAGKAPDFDGNDCDLFAYERGRQFAILCKKHRCKIPPNRIGRSVNWEAIWLFDSFGEDIL